MLLQVKGVEYSLYGRSQGRVVQRIDEDTLK